MTPIPETEALSRFKNWFDKMSLDFKEQILKHCIENRPRQHVRLAELLGYENTGKAFDVDLVAGQMKEDALAQILSGKIEVKTDSKVSETGNVAVEFVCRNQPSGLSTTKAEWWAFVLSGVGYKEQVVVLVETERLKELVKNCRIVKGGDNKSAEMYLLPVERLLECI